jgi:hypothetical protein
MRRRRRLEKCEGMGIDYWLCRERTMKKRMRKMSRGREAGEGEDRRLDVDDHDNQRVGSEKGVGSGEK